MFFLPSNKVEIDRLCLAASSQTPAGAPPLPPPTKEADWSVHIPEMIQFGVFQDRRGDEIRTDLSGSAASHF